MKLIPQQNSCMSDNRSKSNKHHKSLKGSRGKKPLDRSLVRSSVHSLDPDLKHSSAILSCLYGNQKRPTGSSGHVVRWIAWRKNTKVVRMCVIMKAGGRRGKHWLCMMNTFRHSKTVCKGAFWGVKGQGKRYGELKCWQAVQMH